MSFNKNDSSGGKDSRPVVDKPIIVEEVLLKKEREKSLQRAKVPSSANPAKIIDLFPPRTTSKFDIPPRTTSLSDDSIDTIGNSQFNSESESESNLANSIAHHKQNIEKQKKLTSLTDANNTLTIRKENLFQNKTRTLHYLNGDLYRAEFAKFRL